MSKGVSKVAIVAALVALTLTAVSCSSSSSSGNAGGENGRAKATTTTVPAPKVTSTVQNGATAVSLTTPVGISVTDGTLATVTLRTSSSVSPTSAPTTTPETATKGVFNADRTGWLSPSDFAPDTTYLVAAVVTDAAGRQSNHQWTFTTGAPANELHTNVNVDDGATYGVGMPIVVKFNMPVPAALRSEVLGRIKVQTAQPIVGGWHWFSDSEVHYRPQNYWPAHTQIALSIDFKGLHLGPGAWGVDGRTIHFAIGDSHVSIVDTATHRMTVSVNGQQVNDFPISAGRPGLSTTTRSGIHVVSERDQTVVMDSSTIGIPVNSPNGYRLTVQWAVRISNSGEYVHSAPWSVGSQGYENVSHGCVNASPTNAEWFYNLSMPGDIVNVVNSGRPLEAQNGYGDWVIPWEQWVN